MIKQYTKKYLLLIYQILMKRFFETNLYNGFMKQLIYDFEYVNQIYKILKFMAYGIILIKRYRDTE